MLYANVGGITDSEKQEIAIEFCKSQNKTNLYFGRNPYWQRTNSSDSK